MCESVCIEVDVTDATGLGEPAHIAVTVTLPEPDQVPTRPVVCFAKPGTGFSRRYFTTELPGPVGGAQAQWHAERGWVFVSVDHLGVGDSSTHEMSLTGHRASAAAAAAAEREVLELLAKGAIAENFPAIEDPLVLGLGQSVGANLTLFQQACHQSYHGIALLGYGVFDMEIPVRPGDSPIVIPWFPRDDHNVVLNAAAVAAAGEQDYLAKSMWFWFYDDVGADSSLVGGMADGAPANPWISPTLPGVMMSAQTPGSVYSEAAAVTVPVLLAFGERDVCSDPRSEPRAYRSAASIDLFICPRMGHMHNFAGNRQVLWQRIETWAHWVGALTSSGLT
jgi:pimeloyl-ACP methyl ester carboxylesterase